MSNALCPSGYKLYFDGTNWTCTIVSYKKPSGGCPESSPYSTLNADGNCEFKYDSNKYNADGSPLCGTTCDSALCKSPNSCNELSCNPGYVVSENVCKMMTTVFNCPPNNYKVSESDYTKLCTPLENNGLYYVKVSDKYMGVSKDSTGFSYGSPVTDKAPIIQIKLNTTTKKFSISINMFDGDYFLQPHWSAINMIWQKPVSGRLDDIYQLNNGVISYTVSTTTNGVISNVMHYLTKDFTHSVSSQEAGTYIFTKVDTTYNITNYANLVINSTDPGDLPIDGSIIYNSNSNEINTTIDNCQTKCSNKIDCRGFVLSKNATGFSCTFKNTTNKVSSTPETGWFSFVRQ